MTFNLPHIEKFISPWLCAGITIFGITAFLVILFVLATSRTRPRRRCRPHNQINETMKAEVEPRLG
jgi:hypothetical protein